jgi:hypothetical protein
LAALSGALASYATPPEKRCRSARVAVAPIRFGARVKGKLNLTMAHGTRSMVSGIAAEQMQLRHGEGEMIDHDPADVARAVTAIHTDEHLWLEVSRLGGDSVRHLFSVKAVGD